MRSLGTPGYHVGSIGVSRGVTSGDYKPSAQSLPIRPTKPMYRLGEYEPDPNSFGNILSRKQRYHLSKGRMFWKGRHKFTGTEILYWINRLIICGIKFISDLELSIKILTALQRSFYTCLSVILSTGGSAFPQCRGAVRPPFPSHTHLRYGKRAGGTNPTGMYTC